jgi:hypothetical protein
MLISSPKGGGKRCRRHFSSLEVMPRIFAVEGNQLGRGRLFVAVVGKEYLSELRQADSRGKANLEWAKKQGWFL